jgi:hypothetical protein
MALLAALVMLGLTAPVSAGAYLYWSENGGISRANFDGGEVQEDFMPKLREPSFAIQSLAVGGRYMYISGSSDGLISRAKLSGGQIEPDFAHIPEPQLSANRVGNEIEVDARWMTVAGGYVYWSGGDGWGDPSESEPDPNPLVQAYKDAVRADEDSVGRVRINGSDPEPNFIQTGTSTLMVTAYAGHLYWASEHAIIRANLNGSHVEPNFIKLPEARINGLYVADDHIYWATEHTIVRANLDGGHVNRHFITGLGYVNEVCGGGGYVYWGERPTSDQSELHWIGRANLNGTAVRPRLLNLSGKTWNGSFVVDGLGPGAAHLKRRRELHPEPKKRTKK